jgi:triosephosphate isomerase
MATTPSTAGGRRKLIAGNWKMFTTPQSAPELARAVVDGVAAWTDRVGVLVCPPFPVLGLVGAAIKGSAVALGAQNCFCELEGAYTGEVSPRMLREMGCDYVILGHSERRHKLGESDEFISKKARCALGVGLSVILCLGETEAEREANETEQVLDRQFRGSLAEFPRDKVAQLLLAYEPVWAIGTGRRATPEQAEQAHAFLRRRAATEFGDAVAQTLTILYGGSVKPDNLTSLFAQPDVDGGLVGGASLIAPDFLAIVKAALPASAPSDG